MRVFLSILLLLMSSNSLKASEFDNYREALDVIADFADRTCTKINTEGSYKKQILKGDAEIGLKGIINKVANLGFGGAASVEEIEYKNVLHKDLPNMVKGHDQCKLTVFQTLQGKLVKDYNPTKCVKIVYKQQEHSSCGVKTYNNKKSQNCGITSHNINRSSGGCSSCGGACDSMGGAHGSCSERKKSLGSRRECSMVCNVANTCRIPSNGVESYNSCRKPEFGIEDEYPVHCESGERIES